jgi:hypothetical protein
MAITFSFKEQRKIEQEKYDYPVLTQRAFIVDPTSQRTVAKFALNKAALKALGYPEKLKDCKISVGRDDETNELVLVNTTGADTDKQFNVTADATFNSKFLLDRLTKEYPIDIEKENEFQVVAVQIPGEYMYGIITHMVYSEEEVLTVDDEYEEMAIEMMTELDEEPMIDFDPYPSFNDNTTGYQSLL